MKSLGASVYSGTDKEILQRLSLLKGTENGFTEAYIQSAATVADMDYIVHRLNGQTVEEIDLCNDAVVISVKDYAGMLLSQLGYVCNQDYAELDVLSFFSSITGAEVSAEKKFTIHVMAEMTVAALHTAMKDEKRKLLGSVMAKMEPIEECQYTEPTVFTEEMRTARETAKYRKRTLIYNNDGNDTYRPYREYPGPFDAYSVPDEVITIENFLAERMTGLEDSQVDSVFFCTGTTGSYHHKSKVADMRRRDWSPRLIDKLGVDSLDVIIQWCRENDREVMWSMRMNDHHDRRDPDEYLNKFKREHLHLLVGERSKDATLKLASGYWSCVDYAEPIVRQWIYDILREILLNYDVDGVELDFTRTGVFFRQLVQEGEDVNAENLERMNNLLRSLRTLTEQISVEKGKPILLAVHLADSVAYNKATGLDVLQWLDEDLVDMVAIRSFGAWQSMRDALTEYEGYNVPVYLIMDAIAADDPAYDWNKEAGLAYHLGYAGIQVFNFYDPHSDLFDTLGEIDTTVYDSAYQEKTCPENGNFLTFAKDSVRRFMSYRSGKSLWFTEREVTKAAGDRKFSITARCSEDGTVVYSSSNPVVATVDPINGCMQIRGVGTTEITAVMRDFKDSYILTVKGRSYEVDLPEGVCGENHAVYLMDYCFTTNQMVSVTVGGKIISNVVVSGSTWTIPGEYVTEKIRITVES